MKHLLTATLISGLLALAPASAQAEHLKGKEVQEIMQALGYKAELKKDGDGDPLILSAASGVNFNVVFYDCQKGRCGSLQFKTGWAMNDKPSAQVLSDWNRQHRYAFAYLDDEQDPILQMDFDIEYTQSKEAIEEYLSLWERLISSFQDHMRNRE